MCLSVLFSHVGLHAASSREVPGANEQLSQTRTRWLLGSRNLYLVDLKAVVCLKYCYSKREPKEHLVIVLKKSTFYVATIIGGVQIKI